MADATEPSNQNEGGDHDGGERDSSPLTPQQQVLQRMVAMQHAQQESREDSHRDGSKRPSTPDQAEMEPPRRRLTPPSAKPLPAAISPSAFLGLSMSTPTVSNVTLTGAAGGSSQGGSVQTQPVGRTAVLAKLLPTGGGGVLPGKPGSGMVDYQKLSKPKPTSQGVEQQQLLSQPSLSQVDNFFDAASHDSGSYGSAGPNLPQHLKQRQVFDSNYHYGGLTPDPFDGNEYSAAYEFPFHHADGGADNQCGIFTCFTNIFCHRCDADNIRRSLCFGAIDGILTGSGISAACAGLGILNAMSEPKALWAVAALSLAACSSDGVCMAIGHVWSTFILQRSSLLERRDERLAFNNDRAACKVRLVDMLLSRGMLKIDAATVADVLEGYPDMFVNAIVGESGPLGPGGSLGSGEVAHHHDDYLTNSGRSLRSSLHEGSYGQFDEYRENPEKKALDDAMKDGWSEALIMMVSFSSFSTIPSLSYLLALRLFPVDTEDPYNQGNLSSITVAIAMVASIMLLLGVWKSKFFHDAHFMVFGIETVLVLFTCLFTGYFAGVAFKNEFQLESVSLTT